MNPQRDYEAFDETTTRAFIELFRVKGDVFNFAIDSRGSDSEELKEVEAFLSDNSTEYDLKTMICVTTINDESAYNELRSWLNESGITVVENSCRDKVSDDDTEYTVCMINAGFSDSVESASWNRPCLLVYGSLTPALEECCYNAFGSEVDVFNVRNHYVIRGDSITDSSKDVLADCIRQSGGMLDDDKSFYVSSVRTAAVV